MKTTIFNIICLTAILITARCLASGASAEKTISKSFTVEPGGDLIVDADQGDIEVVTGDKSVVDIVVEREVEDASEGKTVSALKSHKVTFSTNDNKVNVEAVTAKKSHGLFSSSQPRLHVHFQITVPRRFNASLNTTDGNIKVTYLNGSVDAHSSGGNLTFAKIQGAVDGHTSGGAVKATDCADKLTVQSSGGSIAIKNYTGPSASADTMGGNIEVAGCAGALQTKTSGGNILITAFSGASAYADTSGGSISIDLDKQPTGDSFLRTSGGNITAKMPEDMALNLMALTDGGSVNSAIPVKAEGKEKSGSLVGKMNGGGPKFVLRTSGGNISVIKN